MVVAAQFAWLEVERRNAFRLAVQLRQQLRQSEEMAEASPARIPENEQAMADDLLRLRGEVSALRAELFPQADGSAGNDGRDGRIDAYFDVAALIVRLHAAAAVANVIVKPNEHFGFGAYANEAPPVAGMTRVSRQCLIVETLVGCLLSGRPRQLLAVRRESVESNPVRGGRQQGDYFVLERGLSLRGEAGLETMAFQVEFSGETAALRGFLAALAQVPDLLVVRSVEVMPGSEGKLERAGGKASAIGSVARGALSRFAVTVEAVRPTETLAVHTP